MEPCTVEQYKGLTIEIHYDDPNGIITWEELTNHDKQDTKEDFYILAWHRNIHLSASWGTPQDVQEWAKENKYWIFPLYLYEHGNRAWKTSPFSCPWDSGQAGFVLIKKKSFRLSKTAAKFAKSVVTQLDDVDNGNVFGFIIKDQEGEEIDSCWGFIGEPDYCLTEAKRSADHAIEQENNDFLPGMTKQQLLDNGIIALQSQ